jgi:hypothetical protein
MAVSSRLAVLFVFFTWNAAAQRYAHLYGRILDTSEGGISQAAITVVNLDNGFRRATESDPSGVYAVGSLQPGLYKVAVRKEGFHTVERYDLNLPGGLATRADFMLPVGAVEESITVYGDPAPLERADAATETRVDRDEFERLPLNGRGVLTLLEMAPGTNVTPATRGEAGQFTTSGQRPNTNYFTIDGISANTGVMAGGLPAQSSGGSLPSLSAFGSLDSLISLEAVREFRVTTSTGMAEMGRMPGAIIALNSRSGTNDFHGTTSYRIRNELASANDWFGNQAGYGRLPERLQDFGQTFGGPVRRNHTFLFASFQRIALRQPYVWRQAVPSAQARAQAADWAQPLLSLFPPASGTLSGDVGDWTGRGTRPASLSSGAVRMDQSIGSRLTAFGRYNDAPSVNEFGTLSLNRLDLRSRSLTLGLNARPNPRLVLDLRANESQSETDSGWVPESGGPCTLAALTDFFVRGQPGCNYLVRFSIGGIGQLVSGREGSRRQRQFQLVPTGSLRLAHHALGFGVDYRRIQAVRRDPTGALGVIADSVYTLADRRNLWVGTTPAQNGEVEVNEFSAWVQDTWQAGSRLTVSGGVRWEYSPAPVPAGVVYFLDPSTATIRPTQDQRLWPNSYRNFAPRAGLAAKLTADGRNVLRAGGGLYYESSLSIATDVLNGGPLSIGSFDSAAAGLFNTNLTYGFMPGLRLPRVAEWNLSVEHAFGTHDVLSAGYLGAAGRHLLRREFGGPGSSPTSYVALTTNNAFSNYHSLQLQYRRRMAAGLEASAAYAWSHSIDNDSSDSSLVWTAPGVSDKGSSDYDLRQSFTATATYEIAARPRALKGWAIDTVWRARTGFPITVLSADEYLGINLTNAFRPDLNFGVPLWITDANSAGGRRLNPAAFTATAPKQQGTLGRNPISGFGMTQLDLALRREFRFTDRCRLQFRLESYNALNHPNFADAIPYLNSPVFGESISMLNLMLGTGSPGSGLAPILQTGGARSVQASLRFQF